MKGGFILVLMVLVPSVGVAQETPTSAFHDDLLEHLVGKWNVRGIVHGRPSRQTIDAEWVLNHQFLRVYEKSAETVAGTNVPYEGVFYFGFDNVSKRYVVHLLNVFGGRDSEGLGLGQRSANEIKVTFKTHDASITSRFVWQPEARTWRIVSTVTGESKPIIDLAASQAK